MQIEASVLDQVCDINSLHINTNKKLGLFGILAIMQDMAFEHSTMLGFGYEDVVEKGFFWVLVRQKLRMQSWPKWNDKIRVQTWSKPIDGAYAFREFEFFVGDKKIGDCATTWMILDTLTRKPRTIENSDSLFKPRKEYSLDFSAERINAPKDLKLTKSLDVRISDLDMNQHVNNIKYTQWILDVIPYNYHQNYSIEEYEINFLAETFLKDSIEIHSDLDASEAITPTKEIFFVGKRTSDSKTAFISKCKLKTTKI